MDGEIKEILRAYLFLSRAMYKLQEAHETWLSHLSETANTDMKMFCNIFFNPVIATNERIIFE